MTDVIPDLLAGPLLRHTSQEKVCFWLVTSRPCTLSVRIFDDNTEHCSFSTDTKEQVNVQQIKVGDRVYVQLLEVVPHQTFPVECPLYYDIAFDFEHSGQDSNRLQQLVDQILYPNESYPSFEVRPKIADLLHGSCRKPHQPCEDGMLKVDAILEEKITQKQGRPSLLMLSGDQVYVDDVAGPMLVAIHQLIGKLGLFSEQWEDSKADSSEALFKHPCCYYQRESLLPQMIEDEQLYKSFISAKEKPVFTSVHAENHLITFAEMMAMYLLVWSPQCWKLINLDQHQVRSEFAQRYAQEAQSLKVFIEGLSKVQRSLAHIPSYMIFDDHDITDDWNLTRGWEELAYGNPFSKRIIGNALMAYLLCQGWGNQPQKVAPLMVFWQQVGQQNNLLGQDQYIDLLLGFNQWHYNLDTSPTIVVLDTRTQRWRSESNANKPSGLMDWESLSELQQTLIGLDSVIMVSPAPVFGVKLIEAVQKIFTFFGKALMVDAENWMAHQGAASVLLNIFRHPKTPEYFYILSGDVHYSFVYDVSLRFRRNSPSIMQITCSGIKNEFPKSLLKWLDRINYVLYHRFSPLNWFTKRRNMRISVRKPDYPTSPTLANQAGIGYFKLQDQEKTAVTKVLSHTSQDITFLPALDKDENG